MNTKDFVPSSQRGKEGRQAQVLEGIIAEHPFLKGLSRINNIESSRIPDKSATYDPRRRYGSYFAADALAA